MSAFEGGNWLLCAQGPDSLSILPIPIPPDLLLEARDWIGEHIDDQRFDSVYMFLGGGGVAIRNAESHEEVYDELLAYPLYGFFDWSVEALVDWEHGFGTITGG